MTVTPRASEPIADAIVKLVKGSCYHPEDLEVSVTRTNAECLRIDLTAHSADAPILIGSQGRHAKALKFIASAMGERSGLTVVVQLHDSYKGKRESHAFEEDPNFTTADFLAVLAPVLELVFGHVPPMELREVRGRDCLVIDVPKEQSTLMQAITDCFYPFGIRNGRKLRILNKNYQEPAG